MAKQSDNPNRQGKSKYAQKQKLKRGNGVVSPRWMSWLESPDKPRKLGMV
jgi:hypothetical protein